MATLREMLVRLNAIRLVDQVIEVSYAKVAQEQFHEESSPHGVPWHVSFHASQFPGDAPQACGRLAMYGMMDIKFGTPVDRWLDSVAQAGKAIELTQVRAVRDGGRLVRSAVPGISSDPDSGLPQMGFRDAEHWLTGSVDMPIIAFGEDNRTMPVEIKTKHESKIDDMMANVRGPDEAHRRQLLCALGLAHENPDVFLHPTENRGLEPAIGGAIYYVARDTPWPGPIKTFEFYFDYDPEFMAKGRAHLAKWKQNFIDDVLPQDEPKRGKNSHPFNWKWSEGICKYCDAKKMCRMDYDAGVTKLSESRAIMYAQFSDAGYNPQAKRDAVLDFWSPPKT